MLTHRKKTRKLFFNRPIILDIEGFNCGKKPFIIKEISVCFDTKIDTIHFLPSVPFNTLSKEEKKVLNWISKFLHGVRCHEGEYPYSYLDQICDSISLRNPNSQFFARGIQKSVLLAEYLKLPVSILEDISSPKIEHLLGRENLICKRQSHQLIKLCTCRKIIIFSIEKKNCPMMQATLSPILVAYTSTTNKNPEKNLTTRIELTFTRTGLLGCRGKPILQKLEQITLNDIEIDNLWKLFTVLD